MSHEQLPMNSEDGLVGMLDVRDGRLWIQASGVVDLNGIDELGTDAGRLNEENTGNIDDDIRGHDSNKVLFHAILANMRRTHELMIQDVEALLDLGPKLVSQLSNWANDMREHRFSPAEVVELLDKAGKMTNRYFMTLAIVNRYWNLLLRNIADILEATNISNPVKTSMGVGLSFHTHGLPMPMPKSTLVLMLTHIFMYLNQLITMIQATN